MSHKLTINSQGEAEMFSGSGLTPWHKLGTVCNGLLTAREAIEVARMGWTVEKRPIFVNGLEVPDYRAISRADNNLVLSIMGKDYETIQNSECFDFFDNVVGDGQAIYDTAGSLFGGRKVWIMAKLKGLLFIDTRPDDVSHKFVLLVSSHDGSSSLQMMIVSVRVVCNNTLTMALNGQTNVIKIRHTKNYEGKKNAAVAALRLSRAYFDNLQEVMNVLASQEMNQAGMVSFTEKLIPTTKDEASTQTVNARNDIVTLFSRGMGNIGVSRWDALNAVTEYVDHNRGTRTKENGNADENKFASNFFGSGARLKERALGLLVA